MNRGEAERVNTRTLLQHPGNKSVSALIWPMIRLIRSAGLSLGGVEPISGLIACRIAQTVSQYQIRLTPRPLHNRRLNPLC